MPVVTDEIVSVDMQSVKEVPSWLIRNGNAMVLIFFVAIVITAFFCRYSVWLPINLIFKSEKGRLIIVGETGKKNMRDLKKGQVVSIRVLTGNEKKSFKFKGKIISEKRLIDSVSCYYIGLTRASDSTIKHLILEKRVSGKYGLVDVGSDNFLTKIFGNLFSNKKTTQFIN